MYKPHWNETLQLQWDKVVIAQRAWLKYTGSGSAKKDLKMVFCME